MNIWIKIKKGKLLKSKNFYRRLLIITPILIILSIFFSDYLVKSSVKSQIFKDVSEIPHNKVGLVLGTSKYLASGHKNAYYSYRINATYNLYRTGKIDFVLVSGDNGTIYYNEPTAMKKDLISKGIPSNKIFLDYAGFRTLDSVVRSSKVFGQKSITIISQKFHIERAIYIANHNNIDAVGYVASEVSAKYGMKTKIREKFARVKLMLDIIFHTQPKFLGEPVIIN
jgi:SanA protein